MVRSRCLADTLAGCPGAPAGLSSGSPTSTTRSYRRSPPARDLISGSNAPAGGAQLDEIAGAKAVVELVHENAFPSVAAGARRTGRAKR